MKTRFFSPPKGLALHSVMTACIGAGLTLSLNAVEMLAITCMGMAYALVSAAIGLLVNLKSHSFDWTSDAVVVKQSAAAGISVLIGMALVIAPIVLTVFYLDYAVLIYWLATAVMALIGIGLNVLFAKKGDVFIRAL